MSFTFTRAPSEKIGVSILSTGLVQADNELILIGHLAADASVDAGSINQIENYGDPVLALAECIGKFGAASDLTEMVVAAVKANYYGGVTPKVFPPIKAIAMAVADADLVAFLAGLVTQPMPFVAIPFGSDDAVNTAALRAHLVAISSDDRGKNAQFGSFGFVGAMRDLASEAAVGELAATETMIFPWLRDLSVTPANAVHEVAAATAAICATCGSPFLPLNGIVVGGLKAPTSAADNHSAGDTGTEALGLYAGLVPLMVEQNGTVSISRTVTASDRVPGIPDTDYFDMQDFQALYYFRKNAYLLTQQERYKRAKMTSRKLLALKSELIVILKRFEVLEIFQNVDDALKDFTVTKPADNRFAGVYTIPIDVVPGFHNKGIALVGTDAYDTFSL